MRDSLPTLLAILTSIYMVGAVAVNATGKTAIIQSEIGLILFCIPIVLAGALCTYWYGKSD